MTQSTQGPGKGAGQRGKQRGIYNGKHANGAGDTRKTPPADPAGDITVNLGGGQSVTLKDLTNKAVAALGQSFNVGSPNGQPQPPAQGFANQISPGQISIPQSYTPNQPTDPAGSAPHKPTAEIEPATKAALLKSSVINLLENNETPSEKHLSIVGSTRTGLDMYFASLARTMARSTTKLAQFCDRAEEELFDIDNEAWASAQPWEKFRFYQQAMESYQTKLNFISKVSKQINWHSLETEIKQLLATLQADAMIDPSKQQAVKSILDVIISGGSNHVDSIIGALHPASHMSTADLETVLEADSEPVEAPNSLPVKESADIPMPEPAPVASVLPLNILDAIRANAMATPAQQPVQENAQDSLTVKEFDDSDTPDPAPAPAPLAPAEPLPEVMEVAGIDSTILPGQTRFNSVNPMYIGCPPKTFIAGAGMALPPMPEVQPHDPSIQKEQTSIRNHNTSTEHNPMIPTQQSDLFEVKAKLLQEMGLIDDNGEVNSDLLDKSDRPWTDFDDDDITVI